MFASFADLFRSHREESTDTIAELVRRVVDGETIPPAVLFKAATTAGMSGEDVDAMARRMRHRDQLRRAVMDMDGAAAEVAKLTDAISRHDATLDDARRRHEIAVAPLREQLAAAESRHAAARRADSDLLDPRWMEPTLVERLRRATEDRYAAAALAGDLQHKHREQQRRHDQAERELADMGHDVARLKKMWENESAHRQLPHGTGSLLYVCAEATTMAQEIADKIPAALDAAEAAKRRVEEIQAEARAS